MRLWNRIRLWLERPRAEEHLAEEIRLHRELLEEQFTADGMSSLEAHAAAARQFGNSSLAAEASRDQWNIGWLAAAWKDFRFACRLVRRQPLLSIAVVLTVAFAVGANTAVVSVLETVLLNPAGLRHADRIAVARERIERLQFRHVQTSAVEYREIQLMTDTFSAVAAMEGHYWTSQIGGEPNRLRGLAITPDFFRVFSVDPAAGRFFSAEDRQTVVLSHRFWQTYFAGDASAVGRSLLLDDVPHRIIGVAPADFHFPPDAQVWTPLILEPQRLKRRGYQMSLWLFARLKAGVSMKQAADRVNRYVVALKSTAEGAELAQYGYGIDVDPVADFVVGDLRRPLWLLFAAALVVLLTGCANVAGLLLTRAAGRRREIAIRISIGAGRTQIVRQLLIESLLLAALGGLLGLLLAYEALPLITRLAVPGKQWLVLVALDQRIMAYGMGVALSSGLLFGLAPALQLFRDSQAASLARMGRRWFQDIFVTTEVAGAFVLVFMTILLLRSLWLVEQIQPGFDSRHLATAFLMKPTNDPGFLDRLLQELGASPGVESAALAYPLPFSGGGLTSGFDIRHRQRSAGEPEWHGEAYLVSPEYFRALGIPLLQGRGLQNNDTDTSQKVCIIDSRLASRFFPDGDPIGQEIFMYGGWARIVGIVGTIRGTTLEDGSRPVVYYPLAQVPFFPETGIVVRSPVDATSVIRKAVRQSNRTVPIFDAQSMEERIGESLGIRRMLALLLTIFGGLSLLLAAIGIYGVVAQLAAESTCEIGVRIAMGARPDQIFVKFARRGLEAGVVGIGIGTLAALFMQKWLVSFLYQLRPVDLATFGLSVSGILLLLIGTIWWPVWRAARTDPQRALHYE